MGDKEKLITSYGEHVVGFRLPAPISEKLNTMVTNYEEASGEVAANKQNVRNEIVGMLLAFAPIDGETLAEQMRKYRAATRADIYPEPGSSS